MYIRGPEAWNLSAPPVANPAAKPYRAPITNGGQFIQEGDADKLLTILSGPSPYQNYIQPIIAVQASSKLPTKFLRIVSSTNDVPAHLRGRFVKEGNKVVGGTIDRATGTIYMLPAPGRRADTRLEFALHEAVHLFAHPFMSLVDEKAFQSKYGRSCVALNDVGSFQRKYCFGLGEGATQAITEQIMKAQGISKYSGDRPYKEFTPVALRLIEIFSPDKFARAFFWGAVKQFTEAMEARWGPSWQNVVNFTAARATKRALDYINELEVAYIKRRSPKGDYPILPQLRRYA
jgi:hypothetical protein